MRIRFEMHDDDESVEVTSDYDDCERVVEMFGKFLVACGFHPDTVKEFLVLDE